MRSLANLTLLSLFFSGLLPYAVRVTGAATDAINSETLLLTYHGPVEVGTGPLQVQVLLHVLVKAKRQADDSYVVRTVSYAERPEIQGNQLLVSPLLCRF